MGGEGGGQLSPTSPSVEKCLNRNSLGDCRCLTGDFQMQGQLGAGYEGLGNPQTHLTAKWGGCLQQLSCFPHVSVQNDL